jgi:peptide deformylase
MSRVLLLGDPRLRRVSQPVEDVGDAAFRADAEALVAELAAFRAEHGFGRAIAAPQIGVPRRLIAMDLGEGAFILVNPEITWRSDETFTMWDDCMSFPWLFVKVRRHDSISVRWLDGDGQPKTWERLARAESELLQHEIDHLDGVLAVDHALDRGSLVSREVLAADRARFEAAVDYVIGPAGRTPAAR